MSSRTARLGARLGLLSIGASLLPGLANAQQLPNLDPSTLNRIQQQLTGGSTGNLLGGSNDQFDQSRRQDQAPAATSILTNGMTPEEIEARRLRAGQTVRQLYAPSRIEREYRERTGDNELRQFGYDLFQSAQGLSGPVTGEVGDNYILGVGDELVVNFQGATNDSRTVRVNREGQIIVSGLPPIRAAGRSLGAVRSQLASQTRQTMLGTNVYASVGSVRAITIFVGGEVNRPGQYALTSLADVASALARADGVRRTGSLRRVRVVRGGQVVSVDLYGLLGIGMPPSVRLQDGDRIIVPAIGDTVAVTGGVTRPGIYELRTDATISEVVEYAGGPLRSRGSKVTISRIGVDGVESFVPVAGTAQRIQPNDVLQVIAGSSGIANRVQLRGHVDSPGTRPLQAASTVGDLVGSVRDLRPDTYLPFAVLERVDPNTGGRVYEGVNLAAALDGRMPVALRPEDSLWILSRSDIDFINSASLRQAALGREAEVQCRSLREFSNTVRDSQQVRFNVLTRGAFIIERNGELQAVSPGGNLQSLGSRAIASRARVSSDTATPSRTLPADLQSGSAASAAAAAGAAPGLPFDNSQQLQSQAGSQDPTLMPFADEDTSRNGRARSLCPQIFEDQPDLLPIVVEHAVGIGGAVRRPGAYPVAGQITAADAAAIAGGLIAGSRDVVIDVDRGNAAPLERYALDTQNVALTRVSLTSGDDLRFNAAQARFESGAVLLTGEFQRPGLYTIRKGETLAELIRRAGGLTEYAYPYGAVFTRQSVKQLQEEGFKRTARDLTNGLVAASVRKSGSANLADTIQAIRLLADTEAAGRVVVEADPTVLTSRPGLDTALEAGDAIYMPKQPNFVIVLGDVNNPGAVQFVPNKSVADYIGDAGGGLRTSDDSHVYVVFPNGLAQPAKRSIWRRSNVAVPPGSTIIVPRNLDPLLGLDLVRDITGIVGGLVTSLATVAILANQN